MQTCFQVTLQHGELFFVEAGKSALGDARLGGDWWILDGDNSGSMNVIGGRLQQASSTSKDGGLMT